MQKKYWVIQRGEIVGLGSYIYGPFNAEDARKEWAIRVETYGETRWTILMLKAVNPY